MNFWLKLRVWTKIIFFGLIALYISLFAFFNLDYSTKLWIYPGRTLDSNVLLLAIGAFVLGIIFAMLTRTIFRTIAQLREMKRKRMEKEATAIISRAAKLRMRETAPADPAFPVITEKKSEA